MVLVQYLLCKMFERVQIAKIKKKSNCLTAWYIILLIVKCFFSHNLLRTVFCSDNKISSL